MNLFTRSELEDAVQDGVAALVVRDDTGEILYATPLLEHMFGYVVRGELAGRCVDDLVPADRREVHREIHRPAYAADPTLRGLGQGLILEGEKADRSLIPLVISLRGRVVGSVRCTVVNVINLTGWRAPGVTEVDDGKEKQGSEERGGRPQAESEDRPAAKEGCG